jgi:sec1 family domain-containing protein 1
LSAALRQILNLNQPLNASMAVEPVWKLLIFDTYGQDIISPLLNVKQLREHAVTLHLFVCLTLFACKPMGSQIGTHQSISSHTTRLLDSPRENLPDVPAVYFVSPTEHNIRLICEDLRKSIYDCYYLNMIYPLPRPLLEQLAESAVAGGSVQQVQKVWTHSFTLLMESLNTFPNCYAS